MKMKFLGVAVVAIIGLNVTFVSLERQERGVSLTLSSLEKAEASGEYSGIEKNSKLKRIENCVKLANQYVQQTRATGDMTLAYIGTVAIEGEANVTYSERIAGVRGYYTDCRATLARKCDRSEIDYTCR